ncbi:hypothetical protein QCE47_12530 [Caballeronia sp. LZ025]|uniref:hypothetical protein n=1 Tax=Caballeronia sp. LZ025 TaxID=3038562 RepID=UPI00285FBAFC|nr:hypothetical protein [Caballeronia sp. LZ025]MDR5733167.1 hypothetical protein [Caballeronia sp. LZ025]
MNFSHSGHLGDIVYALPAMQALAGRVGATKIAVYVPSDNVTAYPPEMKHTGGAQMVSRALFDFLAPLLCIQPYIDGCHFVPSHEIPAGAIDFDGVRCGAIDLVKGNIKDNYFKAFAVFAESPRRWLAPSDASASVQYDILISRSERYVNVAIDYGVLAQLGLRIGFVGLEREFAAFRARFPDLAVDYAPVRHALDVCDQIAKASLYIGNQSFFFAIAEALQANRLLETFEPIPNVIPSGGRCGQFLNTYGLGVLTATHFSRSITFPDLQACLRSDYHMYA